MRLADILETAWPDYARRYPRMPLRHVKAAHAILACRTPAMGGRLFDCPDCGHRHFAYHSCNHRNSPQCGQFDQQQWCEKQQSRLQLNTEHFLVTFTVPESVRGLFRAHQAELYSLLFGVTARCIQHFAGDKKYFAGQTGILSVLHTWSRQLVYHPHIHCIVPAGALSEDGRRWRSGKKPDFLFAQKPFRRHYRKLMQEAFAKTPYWSSIPKQVWREAWGVQLKPVGNARMALAYLARYVNKTAISESRLLWHRDQKVCFSYTDSTTKEKKTRTLDEQEFLRRFFQHVLPPGFMRIRYYGLYHHSQKERLALARAYLGEGAYAPESPQPETHPTGFICPCCDKPMRLIDTFLPLRNYRARGPPAPPRPQTNINSSGESK